MKVDKKAQAGLGGISGTAMTLMITGLILVFAVIIMAKFGDMDVIEAGSDAEGAYNDTLDTVTGFSEWLPIVGLLAIAGIIIYLIVNSLPRAQ
jgi:hypothetical protein